MDSNRVALSQKLDGIGWALFFIWIGVALLLEIGWGWGPLGVGAIIVAEAVIRSFMKMGMDRFWLTTGIAFLAGGFWELFRVSWPLVRILIIACGLLVLWSALRGHRAPGH